MAGACQLHVQDGERGHSVDRASTAVTALNTFKKPRVLKQRCLVKARKAKSKQNTHTHNLVTMGSNPHTILHSDNGQLEKKIRKLSLGPNFPV